MKLNEKAMIKALFEHYQTDSAALRFLPQKAREEIALLAPPQHLDFRSMLSPTKWIRRVHYSWFYPHLSVLPPKAQALFFPLFSQQQRSGLMGMLKMEPAEVRLSPFVAFYLAHFLKHKVQREEVIPLDALPQSPLNPLIKVKWSTLMDIVDFLGLFDLACDYKQIVDQTLIKRIYSALSKEKGAFLQYASRQPIKWTSPPLLLAKWDGESEKLHTLLHKRGLMRLTRGIVGEHLSFRWHLIHRFDVGRARVMETALKEPVDRALIPYFRSQVLQIANKVAA